MTAGPLLSVEPLATIGMCGLASHSGSMTLAVFSTTRTVEGFGVSIEATDWNWFFMKAVDFSPATCSSVHFTSSAVTLAPLLNVASRSLNTHAVSPSRVQDSASSGRSRPFAS